MLKVTKCIGVKSFVETLKNIECELKITSGCKKNFMVIKHSIKELLAKSMVTRPMKCIVGYYIGGLNRPISSLEFNQVLKLNGNIYHYSLYI